MKKNKIEVVIDDKIYFAKKDATLLRVCLINGINVEHKCQSGECRKCMVVEKTIQGDTSILACQRVISPEGSNCFCTLK